jgi:hypothetical protein
VALAGMAACGGGGGGGPDAGSSPVDGTVVDADPSMPDAMNGVCEEGGRASSNSYLPFDVGNTWRYRVDQFNGDPPALKAQTYTEMLTPDEDTGPVIVQVTSTDSGTTESWFQPQGDRIVRLRQQDFDGAGNLERTTYYRPHRLRVDESLAHLETGATWTENFIREVHNAAGVITNEESTAEEWSVLNGDIECPVPWNEHRCLHLRRRTITGGTSVKEYWFARGFGKVREEGGVIEELVGCTLN